MADSACLTPPIFQRLYIFFCKHLLQTYSNKYVLFKSFFLVFAVAPLILNAMYISFFQRDLVCDRAWIPPATASIQIGGLLLGNFFSGHIADAMGRKRPIFFSLVLL